MYIIRKAISSALRGGSSSSGSRVPPLGARFLGATCALLGASAVSREDRQAVVHADEGTTPTPGVLLSVVFHANPRDGRQQRRHPVEVEFVREVLRVLVNVSSTDRAGHVVSVVGRKSLVWG